MNLLVDNDVDVDDDEVQLMSLWTVWTAWKE